MASVHTKVKKYLEANSKTENELYNGNIVLADDGDGVVYKGCDIEHWRNEFEGDWHAQTFLHYVNKNGPTRS